MSDQSLVLLDSALVLADLFDLHAKMVRNMRYLEAQGVDLAIARIKILHNKRVAAEVSQAFFVVSQKQEAPAHV